MTNGETTSPDLDWLVELVDIIAYQRLRQMTPTQIGRMLHPDGIAIPYKQVPADVVADHRTRYSRAELRRGQFFQVRGKYTFIMDHDAYDRRHVGK